jgi:hypothetical protein
MAKKKQNRTGLDYEEITRLMTSGLTKAQATRLFDITAQMSALNDEAQAIVKPTEQEKSNSIECYSDNKGYELAEMIVDCWGSWQDIIEDRIMAKGEEENG